MYYANQYREAAAILIRAATSGKSKLTPGSVRTSRSIEQLRVAIGDLNRKVNLVELVEPVNADTEKKKWLKEAKAGNFTNPDFHYNMEALLSVATLESRAEEYHRKARRLKAPTRKSQFDKEMLTRVSYDLLLTTRIARAMLRHDDAKLAHLVAEKFDSFVPLSLTLPRSEAKTSSPAEPSTEPKDYDAGKIEKMFRYALDEYGFDWPIVTSDTAAAIDVRSKSSHGHEIVIPRDAKRTRTNVLRLVGHEIESHVRVSMNGSELFGFGGLDMKTDDETLDEGLAMLSDEAFDLWDHGHYDGPLPWYMLATQMALSGKSFAEISQSLYEMRKDEPNTLTKAYNTTRRVLRGVSDTKNPMGYAFLKDLAYYHGYHLAKELDRAGYAWLLELGSFSYRDLLLVLQSFHVEQSMIPHQRIDLKNDLFLSNL